MILVEAILGNLGAPDWRDRLAGFAIDAFALDQWEAQKNRLRKETEGGLELAVSLPRNTHLRDGDVLWMDDATRIACVARITLKEVMIIDLARTVRATPDAILRNGFELGHALGNQHWPAVVKGTRVYVPLTVDRKVMASVMRTHHFEGIAWEFVPGADVIPYLAPHESRRLFGGADATPHTHVHDVLPAPAPDQSVARVDVDATAEAHDHAHAHSHRHADGTEHDHAHTHAHRHPHDGTTGTDHGHAELHGNFAPHKHDH